MESTLLTAAEAAALLGLSPTTLATWRCLHKGPPYLKIDGRVVYQRDDITSWRAHTIRYVNPEATVQS
jgi:hypothetical protein